MERRRLCRSLSSHRTAYTHTAFTKYNTRYIQMDELSQIGETANSYPTLGCWVNQHVGALMKLTLLTLTTVQRLHQAMQLSLPG